MRNKEYATKPLRCARCAGTGLEKTEGRTADCLMCNGKGMRMVTLPIKEWKEIPGEQLQRI